MEMCYDGALVMPSSCALMSEDEMTYVDGGKVNMAMKKSYLNKSNCLTKANVLIACKMVTGMSKQAIAEEIFAHAILYYVSSSVKAFGLPAVALAAIKKHAKEIYIEDGGDKWYRQGVYRTLWKLNPSFR